MDHELSRHNISTNTSMNPHSDSGPRDAAGQDNEMQQEGNSAEDAKQFGTEFTLRQARLNEELQVFRSLFLCSACIFSSWVFMVKETAQRQ